MYEIDLTQADVFNNPAYYVQQNDLIYVEPNKSASVRSSAFYTFLSAGASIISLISTVVSLVVLITR
jgi:polysaccharide export outer membrane protein